MRNMPRHAVVCLLPAAGWFFSPAPLLPSLVLFLNLWVLSLYDWRFFRLPNLLTLTLFLTGCMAAWISPYHALAHHIYGAIAGFLIFPAINLVYKSLRGRDGIGLGDAKLMAGVGMWLGWQALPVVLLVASLSGLGYGFLTLDRTKGPIAQARLPFGPFLCLGAWLSWLYFWHLSIV